MTRLLAIPNDPTSAYYRSDRASFLGEFNPVYKGNRFFEEVAFLNWKEEEDGEYQGIKSFSFLENKGDAINLTNELVNGKRGFSSPLYSEMFEKEGGRIQEVIESFRPDIIRSFNSFFASELGSIVSKISGAPLIVSTHDPSRVTSSINDANAIICISENLKDICINNYGASQEKIYVIPNGIDRKLFSPVIDNKNFLYEKYSSNNKVLSVGRIVPSKNIETLLDSIRIIKETRKDIIHLHLGKGDPQSIERIENLRDEMGLRNNSYFIGGIKKELLPKYYSWADVYTLPTLWEGLGRAQIEALSCGTPVVTSNYPPMNDVVINGYNGLTADPKNSRDFANKIEVLLEDKNKRKEISKNCRRSSERYDLEEVMKSTCRVYEKVLGKL